MGGTSSTYVPTETKGPSNQDNSTSIVIMDKFPADFTPDLIMKPHEDKILAELRQRIYDNVKSGNNDICLISYTNLNDITKYMDNHKEILDKLKHELNDTGFDYTFYDDETLPIYIETSIYYKYIRIFRKTT